jgi:hypothetical protein
MSTLNKLNPKLNKLFKHTRRSIKSFTVRFGGGYAVLDTHGTWQYAWSYSEALDWLRVANNGCAGVIKYSLFNLTQPKLVAAKSTGRVLLHMVK